MTSPHDQPQSRRAARRALEAEHAGIANVAQPLAEARSQSASSAETAASAPTDMTYRTQVRPRVQQYDERPAAEVPVVGGSDVTLQFPPPIAPAATPERGADRVRRRDFRPRVVEDETPSHAAPAPVDTPLSHHTQGTHPHTAMPAVDAVPPAPVTASSSDPLQHARDLAPDQTPSRRELRELRAAQQAAGTVAQLPARVSESAHPAPVLIEPVHVVPELVHPAPIEHAPGAPTSTGSHWSTGIHDDEDPFENTFSREVGSAISLNTNALVLPEMPTGSIAGPVDGTGEIIVTGMIAVSPMHASRGTAPTLHDSPEFDDLLDGDDLDISAPDSAPVSALKAISSHTSSHIAMTGKPSSSNTITTVLVASTVGMAVVAIGLFVVAAANGLF